jgi:molybdopterin-binding protein
VPFAVGATASESATMPTSAAPLCANCVAWEMFSPSTSLVFTASYKFIDEVRIEWLLAQGRLRIGSQTLTAVITRAAVDELKLRRGDEAMAIVKSTEVMIAREAAGAPSSTRVRQRR